jgi:hypothetical protein
MVDVQVLGMVLVIVLIPGGGVVSAEFELGPWNEPVVVVEVGELLTGPELVAPLLWLEDVDELRLEATCDCDVDGAEVVGLEAACDDDDDDDVVVGVDELDTNPGLGDVDDPEDAGALGLVETLDELAVVAAVPLEVDEEADAALCEGVIVLPEDCEVETLDAVEMVLVLWVCAEVELEPEDVTVAALPVTDEEEAIVLEAAVRCGVGLVRVRVVYEDTVTQVPETPELGDVDSP